MITEKGNVEDDRRKWSKECDNGVSEIPIHISRSGKESFDFGIGRRRSLQFIISLGFWVGFLCGVYGPTLITDMIRVVL